jgi:LacI family transcriptional regulator
MVGPAQSIPQTIPSGRGGGGRGVVRLSEVAVRAGVSTSTASRALNRPDQVSPAAVARVQEVAAQLGYAPNPFARSLRVQESRTLGLVVSDATNPFFAEVARGIEAACFRAGYTLILCNSDRSLEKERQQARVLAEKRVDGVLLFSTSDASAATIDWLSEQRVPVVLVERPSPVLRSGGGVDCVLSDNAGGVRAALEHLARLGHRRVACLAGGLDAAHYAQRVAAFRAVGTELGLEDPGPGETGLVRTGLTTYADGQRAAAELLSSASPPTAVFCTTDTLAIGAVRGAALCGKAVPADVSVVGYGGTEITAYTQPPLTCVVQEKLAVGTRAVAVLLERLRERQAQRARAGEDSAAGARRQHVVPARLVVRESTASRTLRGEESGAPSGGARQKSVAGSTGR